LLVLFKVVAAHRAAAKGLALWAKEKEETSIAQAAKSHATPRPQHSLQHSSQNLVMATGGGGKILGASIRL